MKKWWAVYRLCLTQAFTHRAETLLWVILDIFPSIIVLATWKIMFAEGMNLGTTTFQNLVTYYLGIQVVLNLAETHFEQRWIDTVHAGKIDGFFTKPMSFPAFIVVDSIARKTIAFFAFLLPFGLLAAYLTSTGELELSNITLDRIFLFTLFICCAFIFNFLSSFASVLTAFWLNENAGSVSHLKWILSSVFGGTIAPLALYPQWLQNISALLPFQRLFSTPASILNHSFSISYFWIELCILVGYTIAFWIVIKMFWGNALKRFSSVGG